MSKKNILFLVLISSNCFSKSEETPALFQGACDEKFAEFAEDFRKIIHDYDVRVKTMGFENKLDTQVFARAIQLLINRVNGCLHTCPSQAIGILSHLKTVYDAKKYALDQSEPKR